MDEQRAAANRAMMRTLRRMSPNRNTGEWTPADYDSNLIRWIVERFGLTWPVDAGEYSKGTFVEVMLWRHEDRDRPIMVLLYGYQIGWVPEDYRLGMISRFGHVKPGTMSVCVPAQLWVSSAGKYGITVQA